MLSDGVFCSCAATAVDKMATAIHSAAPWGRRAKRMTRTLRPGANAPDADAHHQRECRTRPRFSRFVSTDTEPTGYARSRSAECCQSDERFLTDRNVLSSGE